MQQPSRVSPTKKHVILFLAANPPGTRRLSLDEETHSVHVELKRSGYRDRFNFVIRWAAEPLDLLRELRELKPTVVHFAGHGEGAASMAANHRDVVVPAGQARAPVGLYFHSAAGGVQLVTAEAIAQTFGSVSTRVQLVVLNACYSAAIADALLAHVDCIVGMTGAIHHDAARSFAIGFYGGLGEHESVATAFMQGRAAINLDGLPDADQPQLKVRDGFDAAQHIPAALQFTDAKCPYPGMRPFEADDAHSFYGRDAEIKELIDRLRAGEREVFVIGPSGSGKSSLVKAGVVPRLAHGLSGSGPFVVRELRPGKRPATQLGQALGSPAGEPLVVVDRVAALLGHRGPGASLLILVDQLEELFTQASADESEQFIEALRTLRTEARCAVVFTLRADFFGAFMESTLWAEQRGKLSRVEVSPLRDDALREAIAAPAEKAGVTVEPKLIERLVADAAFEPGILPLLQDTLVQLWDEARKRDADPTLTLADYQALGDGVRSGLAVALARRADATLRSFTAAETTIARRILLRLISFGEGRPDTRQQQPRSRLCASDEEARVLAQLIEHRLLTSDEDDDPREPRIDLAHEAMIAAWSTLTDWIQKHRADEQRRRQFEAAAAVWVEHGRGARGLLDAIELADAELWQQTESAVQLGQSVDVMALIAASRGAQTKQRRRRRRLIGGAFAALTAFAAVVTVLAIAARNGANDAHEQANRAQASEREQKLQLARLYMEHGRRLVVDEHYQEAVPYLLEARRNGLAGPPLRMLFQTTSHVLPVVPALAHQGQVVSAEFSPDGTRVVTASWDNTAQVWDAATGKPLTSPLPHQGPVVYAEFSPDGTRVVTASWDNTARIWNITTGKPLTSPLAHKDRVASAAFSPDGTRVVTASWDNTARVWDAATGKPITSPLQHQGAVRSTAFNPDGTRVVTASWDNTARVWDVATGKPITSPLAHKDRVASAAFSPDGTRVVTASWDHTARMWDAATGKPITGSLAHQGFVVSAAFSSDGTRVATASWDNTARVWDAATGKPITSPLVHQGFVVRATFSPDGTRVITASKDQPARVWDATTGTPRTSPFEHQGKVASAVFSPDGTHVVTASDDHTARVWDATTSMPLTTPLAHRGYVRSAAFSPDSTRVATASDDKTARVWDTVTGKPLTSPLKHQDRVVSAAFSPDGTRVVTASDDKTARIWDAVTGKPLTSPLEHQDRVVSAAFSPDGTRVVTASDDKTARVWDAATGKPLTAPLGHPDRVASAAFSPDGTRVVTASDDKTARVWDAATGKPLTAPLGHPDRVASAAFSPDGTRLVTACDDQTVRLWNAATGKPIISPFEHRAKAVSAAFSPDGTRVITTSDDKTARVWDAVTGMPLISPLEHHGPVVSAAFSADGTRVVTASWDGTARVWDAATGKPLGRPLEHQDRVVSAVFSRDGTRVVTASWDGTARVWDIRLDTGTLEEWSAIAERSPFVLQGDVLVRRALLQREPKPAN